MVLDNVLSASLEVPSTLLPATSLKEDHSTVAVTFSLKIFEVNEAKIKEVTMTSSYEEDKKTAPSRLLQIVRKYTS